MGLEDVAFGPRAAVFWRVPRIKTCLQPFTERRLMQMTAAVFALGLAPILASAQQPCSVQTLKGQYILSGRGFIEPGDPGVPRVHRGLLVFDGNGNVTGKQSSSRSGKIGHEKLQGTYTLDADCSGTMTFGSVANTGSQIH